MFFANTLDYLNKLNLESGSTDELDKVAYELINNEWKYEKASQALRRRFSRGAELVDAIDRGGRPTMVKREEFAKGKYHYLVQGADGNWNQPEERIWIVAMYALWQQKNKVD